MYFTSNRRNWDRSVTDPDSDFCKVVEIVSRDRCITREDFYLETRVHPNGDFRGFELRDGELKLRHGWNSSFWGGLTRCGLLEYDRSNREYVPGPEWNYWYSKVHSHNPRRFPLSLV